MNIYSGDEKAHTHTLRQSVSSTSDHAFLHIYIQLKGICYICTMRKMASLIKYVKKAAKIQ